MATKAEIRRVLVTVAAAYPRSALTKATIEVWCRILADLPVRAVEAAALLYLGQAHEFFPFPGQIRQTAFDLLELGQELTAPEAWAEVRAEISRVGCYDAPRFSSPVVGKAVESVGGWKYLCLSEEPVPDRARFYQAFETLSRRARDERRMLPEVRELAKLAAPQRKELDG